VGGRLGADGTGGAGGEDGKTIQFFGGDVAVSVDETEQIPLAISKTQKMCETGPQRRTFTPVRLVVQQHRRGWYPWSKVTAGRSVVNDDNLHIRAFLPKAEQPVQMPIKTYARVFRRDDDSQPGLVLGLRHGHDRPRPGGGNTGGNTRHRPPVKTILTGGRFLVGLVTGSWR